MTNSMRRWGLIGAVIVVALLALWVWRRQSDREVVAISLVDLFTSAEKRTTGPVDVMFQPGTQRIRGETKRAIFMHPNSRLTYHQLPIPERAMLRTWLALKEDAWDKSTDGVLFRVGISSDGSYDEVAAHHVDPRSNVNDRRWIPLEIDLSAYEGQTVDIILNTNASMPGRGNDTSWDFSVWGTPEIVIGSTTSSSTP